MIQVYIRLGDGRERLASISDVLNLDSEAYVNVDDLMSRLLAMQAAGDIRISPNPDALQRMAIRSGLTEYLRRDRVGEIRRFIPTRNGGRINRTARTIGLLDDALTRDAIRGIQRFMNEEGPAAYRSQAQLLGIIDPTADPEIVARAAARAVENAVRAGISEGRASAALEETAV